MSTKTSIWLGADEKGREIHIYWEGAERIPFKGSPIYLGIEVDGKEGAILLPREIGEQIRDVLAPEDSWEVL